MNNLQAFANGEANRGKPLMVFDWDKAAYLIKELKPNNVSAGLRGDWEYTGGCIFSDGKPVPREDTYVYLASTWAIPEIEIDVSVFPCWKYAEGTGWDADTYWPKSALSILDF